PGPTTAFLHGQRYGSTNRIELDASLFAIEMMGTNGLPFLLGKLSATDSNFQRKSDHICKRFGLEWRPYRSTAFERQQAITGVLHRDFFPMWALDELHRMTNSTNADVVAAARFVLTSIQMGFRSW